ncbi:hypothetical protein IHE61_15095 [Streptomyces sp. GKU 257-1]|nr:hypothetical protein [Streptomyces sp. GKU 257-1]
MTPEQVQSFFAALAAVLVLGRLLGAAARAARTAPPGGGRTARRGAPGAHPVRRRGGPLPLPGRHPAPARGTGGPGAGAVHRDSFVDIPTFRWGGSGAPAKQGNGL